MSTTKVNENKPLFLKSYGIANTGSLRSLYASSLDGDRKLTATKYDESGKWLICYDDGERSTVSRELVMVSEVFKPNQSGGGDRSWFFWDQVKGSRIELKVSVATGSDGLLSSPVTYSLHQ